MSTTENHIYTAKSSCSVNVVRFFLTHAAEAFIFCARSDRTICPAGVLRLPRNSDRSVSVGLPGGEQDAALSQKLLAEICCG